MRGDVPRMCVLVSSHVATPPSGLAVISGQRHVQRDLDLSSCRGGIKRSELTKGPAMDPQPCEGRTSSLAKQITVGCCHTAK